MACQLASRMPPEMVSTTEPSALTLPTPTIWKRPVAGDTDHRSSSLPGGMPSRLGTVTATGTVKVTPTGCTVSSSPGSSSSGRDTGATAAGTSETDSWPVKLVPLGFLAVLGGTVMVTSRFGFTTSVVTAGSTVVALAGSIRGRKKGRAIRLWTPSISRIPSWKLAYGEPSGAGAAGVQSMRSSRWPKGRPVIMKVPSTPEIATTLVPSMVILAPAIGVSVPSATKSLVSSNLPESLVGAPGTAPVTVRVTVSESLSRPSLTAKVSSRLPASSSVGV